jgi:Domain of Unknown Function (DUF1206)
MAVLEHRPPGRTIASALGRPSPPTRVVTTLARAGLVAQAIVYLVLGALALQIGFGSGGGQPADQQGALAEVVNQPGGVVLVAVLAAGLGAYALWRASEAAFGSRVNHKPIDRVLSGARAGAYGVLCVSAVLFLTGHRSSDEAHQQATWTGRVMTHSGGRALLAGIGVAVVAAGIGMFIEAMLRRFERQLDRAAVPGRLRPGVIGLGLVGTTARAVIVVLAGSLVIDAALTADPQKSTGVDGAFRTLAETAAGPWLLAVVAIGFIAFGLYAAATARWIKT